MKQFIGRIFNRLLKRYDEREFVIRLKARFIAYCYITEILAILVAIVYMGYANIHNPLHGYTFNFKTLGALGGGLALSITGLVIFVRGHYTLAANLLLICGFATVWTITIIDQTYAISRLDNIVLVVGLLAMTPIVILKRPLAILWYAGINIILLYAFMFLFRGQLNIAYASFISYLADNTVTILAVTVISYQVYTINRRALEKAEHDILVRKRAEALIRKNEAILSSVLNSAPIAVFVLNPDRIIKNVLGNTAEFLLYTNEEMVGRNTRFLYFTEEEYRQAGKVLLESSNTGNISSEVRWRRKDGIETWILLSRFPSTTVKEPTEWVIAAIDISARKKVEEQLRQSQQMEAIGQLAGGIAHDFNNILAVIMGCTELSKMDIPGDSKISGYLNNIMQAGKRAKALVQQILTFSRQSVHEHKPVSVKIVVKEALKFIKATFPSTIDVKFSIKSDGLTMGDPTQIHQVVMNLFTNAGQAMQDKGGVLEVELRDEVVDAALASRFYELAHGPYIHFSVKDTGHGMAPEVVKRIFEPFFSTKARGEGTGLGLSVVHGIMKSMGGAIYAFSELGKGTSFEVFFPRIEISSEKDEQVDLDIPRGIETVLFVDDEPALAEIGSQMLKNLGYQVVSRTSSIEALDLFRMHPDRFDVVITDMTMPQMSGDRLASELLSIREDLPIILSTGFSHQITEAKAKDIGIKGMLMKPIVRVELAKTVRRVLEDA